MPKKNTPSSNPNPVTPNNSIPPSNPDPVTPSPSKTIADTAFTTHFGNEVNFLEPDIDEIDIRDIAHALARESRWGGHTNIKWSVAQHSILVYSLVPEEFNLEALLHDATETYTKDLPTPLKRAIEHLSKGTNVFSFIENKLDQVIRKKV